MIKKRILQKIVKGHITAALLAMAVLFNSISALACSAAPVQMASESEAEYDTVGDPELIAMLTARGRAIRMRRFDDRGFALTGIVRLLQSDPRWANVVMQSRGLTIGKAGCTLTSFTIVSNWLSNRSQTPAEVNTILGDDACYMNWTGAASKFGYRLTLFKEFSSSSLADAKDLVMGSIDYYQKPVIVGMATDSGESHYVVAYGYNENMDIIICDPADCSPTRTTFSQYTNLHYYITQVIMYSR